MSRRQKTSPLEDAIEVASWLFTHISPWWSVPIALVGFVAIPLVARYAFQDAILKNLARPVGFFFGGLWGVVWLVGGVIGWVKRQKQAAFLRQNIDIAWLNGLSWQEFERMVAQVYRQQGFQVEITGGGGSDGGVDLVLTGGNQRWLVQCKRWREFKVGVKPVRELYGVMAAEGAQHGVLITSGIFTEEALQWAKGKPLDLVDGAQCAAMLRGVQQAQSGGTSPMPPPIQTPVVTPSRPSCPVCGSEMVLRRAKRGANAGNEFWGCSEWSRTRCPGTVDVGAQ